MSFLDNLESNLKSLESREEADEVRVRGERASLRAQALAIAPWADQLKNSAFTQDLVRHTTRIGHGLRTKVRIAWIGTTLRLEAGPRRLELRPEREGIVAAFLDDGKELRSRPVDLGSNAEELAREWLA